MSKRAATLTEQGGPPASGISCNVLTKGCFGAIISNDFGGIKGVKSYIGGI